MVKNILLIIMKKTNIRFNNYFLIKDKSKYFLSNIDNYDKWRKDIDLEEHLGEEVTGEYKSLSEKYNVKHTVNFITDQSGGWGGRYDLVSRNKVGGGWGRSNFGN